jgi:hypothetical protein
LYKKRKGRDFGFDIEDLKNNCVIFLKGTHREGFD